MKEPPESIILYNDVQPTPKKIIKRPSSESIHSGYFAIISASLGFICLIPAIIFTLTGAASLSDGDNGRLIAGIVLFGFSITLIILAFLICCLK
ncbi:hypothetical protein I4U23_015211 [Adineta vaga]|nr:hypothetical protein I4U23_015211 [Adineta vaga]